MKRLSLILALALAFSMQAFSQIQISTKKVIIQDLPDKTIYLVQTGNQMLDSLMVRAFHKSWRISPFDMCSDADFDKLCSDGSYYFLLFDTEETEGVRTAGVMSFSIYEGGFIKKSSTYGNTRRGRIDRLFKVISVPVCPDTGMDLRSSIYLSPILVTLQDYLWKAMSNDVVGYGGISITANNFKDLKGKTVLIAREDLGAEFDSESRIRQNFTGNLKCVDSEESDSAFLDRKKDTIVSFTIAPPQDGIAYRMLIDCETSMICFYQSCRTTRSRGFLISDLNAISQIVK